MEQILQKKYPVNANDYRLYEEVGEGVSATVYRALCVPINEIVAIKVLDLEKCNNDLDGIRREVQTMSLIDHPNVLQAHCSFTAGHSLWVVMPYMAGGSCLHIMKTAYPEGFEEPVIATLLREVLRALVYLHAHGHIHRDVKAGNILIDFNGAVKLADFGVSACMFDTGDRQRSRNTFVGTPCWMAPEVMQQLHGYDFKADIWSFGITALELAHGHAPFSKYPPMKVLLMTLQNAPPGLDYERDKRFSKSFKELVAACLVKDPKKRPTSEKLLKHHFFKHARPYEYLSQTILLGLSPLGDRFRVLKAKEADLLLHNKALYGDKEQLSQQEYIRGISAWNFNLDDLKNQAALIPDDDGVLNPENSYMGRKERERNDKVVSPTEWQSPERATNYNGAPIQKDECGDLQSLEDSLASFPIQPLQALKGYFDVAEDDVNASSSCWKDGSRSDCEQQLIAQSSTGATDQSVERNNGEHWVRNSALPRHLTSCPGPKKFFSGSLIHDNAPPKQASNDVDRESQPTHLPERSYSGPLLHRQRRDTNNIPTVDDMLEKTVFQRRGRFKVTSEEVSAKVPPANCFLNPVSGGSASPRTTNLPPTSVVSSLQFILQHNNMQREEIVKLIKHVEQASGNGNQMEFVEAGCNGVLQISPREKELQSQVIHLQQSIGGIIEELQRQKMRNSQLEKQLNALMMNKEGTT